MNETKSVPINRKSAISRNKGFIKIYFYEMEKLLPMEGKFEKMDQNNM